MIVAIPVDETQTELCVSFGRAPYVLFCDTATGSRSASVNPGSEAQSGAGLKAAQQVVDGNAAALITVRCGENAAKVLQAAGVTIYQAQGSVDAALEALQDGKLEKLTHFHPGFVGGQQ